MATGTKIITGIDITDTSFAHLPFDARKIAFMEKITGGDFLYGSEDAIKAANDNFVTKIRSAA